VGSISAGWGESLVWDDQQNRLYFVDCLTSTLHWLDQGDIEPHGFVLPSMPTGVVLTTTGDLVVVLDDGLYTCEPDDRTLDLLTRYPAGFEGRCNDASADLSGNIVTGKLNMGPAEGSSWQFSFSRGWTLLDPEISNTNGPAALDIDGRSTLIVGDTSAQYFAYDYDAEAATVGPRQVFGDTTDLAGHPDGTTVDAEGGLWCALVGGGQLARYTPDGLDSTVEVPATNPTDVTFGGAGLDHLYITTIGGDAEMDGALLVITGLEQTGRPEPRAHVN